MKERPNRQRTCPCMSKIRGVSAQHVSSSPPCLCHVSHIKVPVWWAPAGGRVGVLSQGCASGPNPLINSASAERRWQVGTETGGTPPSFLPMSHPEIPLTSICSLLLIDCVGLSCLCETVHVCMCRFHQVCWLFSSAVYSIKTDERQDLCRAVAEAVTKTTLCM